MNNKHESSAKNFEFSLSLSLLVTLSCWIFDKFIYSDLLNILISLLSIIVEYSRNFIYNKFEG